MVNYRRNYQEDGIYFFTVTLQNRQSSALIEHVDLLRAAIKQTKLENPFAIKAIVILPDHLHTLWELPNKDVDYSLRWKKIKTYFSKSIKKQGVVLKQNKQGEHDLWQRRFWEHTIYDERDYENHVNYIHYNPVKHHYVNRPVDWPYSSIHRYIRSGILTKDWGANIDNLKGNWGE
jgi:putative transposase